MKDGGRDGADGERRLRVGEARGWALVQIAAYPGTVVEFRSAIKPLLGIHLPDVVGQATVHGPRRVLKIGPQEYWIIAHDDPTIPAALQSAVAPTIGCSTSLSHSRTCLWIDGSSSRDVLATGIAIDLHPDVFPINFFALTGLHHTPLMIYRSGQDRFDLYVLRTFALWAWDWLLDAALPYGYEIIEQK
jgi:methylglutamate dehydrogenase subunit D